MQQSLEWTSVIKIFGFSLSLSANIFFTTHDPAGSWRMVDYLTQCLPALAQSLFSFLTPVTGNYRFSRLISLRTNWKVLIRIHSKTLKGRVPESAIFRYPRQPVPRKSCDSEGGRWPRADDLWVLRGGGASHCVVCFTYLGAQRSAYLPIFKMFQ